MRYIFTLYVKECVFVCVCVCVCVGLWWSMALLSVRKERRCPSLWAMSWIPMLSSMEGRCYFLDKRTKLNFPVMGPTEDYHILSHSFIHHSFIYFHLIAFYVLMLITDDKSMPIHPLRILPSPPQFPIMPPSSSHHAYLRLGQTQPAGQLLPLGSNYVVIFLKGSFQTEQLRGRERCPDPFGFPGERTVKQQVLWTAVLAWRTQTQTQIQTQSTQVNRHTPAAV